MSVGKIIQTNELTKMEFRKKKKRADSMRTSSLENRGKKKTIGYLPVYKTLAIMPGKTMSQSGKNLRYAAKRQPALACARFFAARALCTITYRPKKFFF